MSVWEYRDFCGEGDCIRLPQVSPGGVCPVPSCLYCDSILRPLEFTWPQCGPSEGPRLSLLVCDVCGWWYATDERVDGAGYYGSRQVNAIWPNLKNLDLADISAPTKELQDYLAIRYSDRFRVHPRKYEDVVGSVFAAAGYRIRATSYSRDGGIDLFVLDGQGNEEVAIQVKRFRGKIEAAQIREFAGAIVLHGLTKGVYLNFRRFCDGF